MSNARFAEYATSGAFTLSLSRHQVAALAMLSDGAQSAAYLSEASLERKGLVEPVANPGGWISDRDRIEYRPTLAGLLCARLIREAGLSNGPDDPIAAELAALRRETEECRIEAAESRIRATAALARKEEAERELEAARREIRDLTSPVRLKDPHRPFYARPDIRLRDPLPDVSDEALAELVRGPA